MARWICCSESFRLNQRTKRCALACTSPRRYSLTSASHGRIIPQPPKPQHADVAARQIGLILMHSLEIRLTSSLPSFSTLPPSVIPPTILAPFVTVLCRWWAWLSVCSTATPAKFATPAGYESSEQYDNWTHRNLTRNHTSFVHISNTPMCVVMTQLIIGLIIPCVRMWSLCSRGSAKDSHTAQRA